MRQARAAPEALDVAADREVDDDRRLALARRAEQVAVGRIEEEVVEWLRDFNPAQREQALRFGQSLDHSLLVRVHQAGIHRRCVRIGGDLPDLRHVLQRRDE